MGTADGEADGLLVGEGDGSPVGAAVAGTTVGLTGAAVGATGATVGTTGG